jgi:large subunit ribosomal protein L10
MRRVNTFVRMRKLHRDKVRTVVAFRLQPDWRRSSEGTGSSSVVWEISSGLKPCSKRQPGRDVPVRFCQLEIGSGKSGKTRIRHGLNGVFNDSGSVVVAHYAGLTVAQLNDFAPRCVLLVAPLKSRRTALPRSLFRARNRKASLTCSQARHLLPIRMIRLRHQRSPSNFAKGNDKLVILGGSMGATTLNADGVKALAVLPSLDELRAKLLGMIQTPASRIAQVVNAPAAQLARVFGAYARKDEAA